MTLSNFFDFLKNLEWLDLIVATVAVFVFAWAYYGPLFGKAWSAETGKDTSGMPDPVTLVKGFVKFLIFSIGLSALIPAVHFVFQNPSSFETLIVTSFVVTLVTIGMALASRVVWEDGSWKLWGIDYLFWFLAAVISSYVQDLMA